MSSQINFTRPETPLDRMKLVDTVIRSMRVAKVYRDNQVSESEVAQVIRSMRVAKVYRDNQVSESVVAQVNSL